MARFESGPPPRLSGSAANGLVSQPREVEAEPLPWPSAWQPGQGDASGSQGGAQDGQSRPSTQ